MQNWEKSEDFTPRKGEEGSERNDPQPLSYL